MLSELDMPGPFVAEWFEPGATQAGAMHIQAVACDSWQEFIPVQVAGRAPVDVGGMTGRVEELLAMALVRL